MKKFRLILAATFLISVSMQSCSTDDAADPAPAATTNTSSTPSLTVLAEQRAVVTYVGATWCPPCGAYGDPTKIHMESTHGSDVVVLNVQSGDAISSRGTFGPDFGGEFQSFVSSTSIPHAYWSGANVAMIHRGFYTSASANNRDADREINAITSNTPKVGVAASASSSDTAITVHTLSKFYQAAGTHYIGVYLLEDGVDAIQKISGAQATSTSHENVIRASASTTNKLGIESMGTSFTIDQEVSGSYSIMIPSTVIDKSNLQVAVVIWESNKADGISNAILVDIK